jgi:hypothetical protein
MSFAAVAARTFALAGGMSARGIDPQVRSSCKPLFTHTDGPVLMTTAAGLTVTRVSGGQVEDDMCSRPGFRELIGV